MTFHPKLLLCVDDAASLRRNSLEFLLPGDIAAVQTHSPPRLLLPADVVAALRTHSPDLLLTVDVVALWTWSPPEKLLPADVVASKSARSGTKKAVSGAGRHTIRRIIDLLCHRPGA